MIQQTMELAINKKPSFVETWYEGNVAFNGEDCRFWLVDPQGSDYEVDIRWFNREVPKEVRAMHNMIIQTFKNLQDDNIPDDDSLQTEGRIEF